MVRIKNDVFCDYCGEKIYDKYYRIPIHSNGIPDTVCERCLKRLYMTEFVYVSDEK